MLPSEERRRSLWNWLRPQFSLRVLIALVTLFAIGFPIWYRRPYQFTEYLDGGKTTRTTTWQRQWGGSRLQHGEQVVTSGPFTTRSHFQHGELHGSYSVEVTNSAVTGTPITPPINRVQGRYFHGEKDGPWEYHQGNSHGRMNWQNGVLHGVFEFSGHHTGTVAARFNSGRLVELNGKPVADDFVDRFQNKHLDNRVAHELLRETNMDVVQMPLKDCLVYLSHMHNVPIFLDAQVAKRGDDPLTGTFQAMDLKTLLILITAPRGLACDYRYGCLRITTREDAANWLERLQLSYGAI